MNQPHPARECWNLSRWALAFPRTSVLLWIVVSLAGLFAFRSLKYALLPDITFPVVIVAAGAPLPDPLATEEQLALPIEAACKPLPGLDDIRCSVQAGRTMVTLSFQVGTDLARSTEQVRQALARTALPAQARLEVIPLNLNEASVMTYVVEGGSPESIRRDVIPALQSQPGVLSANLLGAGQPTVCFDGRPVLALEIIKKSDANTLEVVDRVAGEITRHQSDTQRFTLARSQAGFIREATGATLEALLIAVALSVVVIYPFLWSWPATWISALAIPTSLLGTCGVMALCGFELDTITLLALALGIGIIIDDAIVDVENIARHLEQGGQSPAQAALKATNEIGLTVTAATLTIVAVFLPIACMRNVIGHFFRPFGITVSASVLISLLVARTLSPVLAMYWLRAPALVGPVCQTGRSSLRSHAQRRAGPTAAYRRLLVWALAHRRTVALLAGASFLAGLALIPLIPRGFIPKLDRGAFKVVYSAVGPAEPIAAAAELEQAIRRHPEVEHVLAVIGGRGEPHRGTLHVTLRHDRTIHTVAFQDRLRGELPRIPGVTTSIEEIAFVETGGEKPLVAEIQGDDLTLLAGAAEALADGLRQLPGVVDVSVSPPPGTDEISRFEGARTARVSANLAAGVSLGDATMTLREVAAKTLPPGVNLRLGGDSGRLREIFTSFGVALFFSVGCVIVVLLGLFRNWVDPVAIFVSLPLSVVGALLALLFSGSEFGMISLIGLIFLLGLVNKNAILLVDFIGQHRAAGLPLDEAILEAAPLRLRPILMTTAATVLGMLPIALGWGAGSELRAPMAIAILGGLVTSTLLSLVVVPVVYRAAVGAARRH